MKVRRLYEVTTEHCTFALGADQLLRSPDGWVAPDEALGTVVAWTKARHLHRRRLVIVPGYSFGYMVGAVCSDGTVGANYVSLVVNDRGFADKFLESLTAATGLQGQVASVSRPSGYLGREVSGWRVRVVSSYLAALIRQYVGGDAHHLRQGFPRVVLRDQETFRGFLDGYVDGDGFRAPRGDGSTIVSANVSFLAELAMIVGARFTPARTNRASQLWISERWPERRTLRTEDHALQLKESSWVEVRAVRPRPAGGNKPFVLHAFRLDAGMGFLVNGHVTRSFWP
ncbi:MULTISPECIES: hypothetical protein [Streptacidiphilus]|uniref:DOD-type homing endonuclease domain-containing protein n=1 Tax=Streptacidiphilus cavernicola TaxID=3342716 RepID=A0ABV6USY5_9ACTN|nr:hypothetical protein [Streptacidiphilus jeojiense]